MALWTFITLVGNGKRVYADQVRASDFRSAIEAWGKTVVIEGMSEDARKGITSWNPPVDAVHEFEWSRNSGVWMFGCSFGMAEPPEEWGREFPSVWVIRTDGGPLSQRELFEG
jgi:hypothetical protein